MMMKKQGQDEPEILPDGVDEEVIEPTSPVDEPNKFSDNTNLNPKWAPKSQIPDWAPKTATGVGVVAGGALAGQALGNVLSQTGQVAGGVGELVPAAVKISN